MASGKSSRFVVYAALTGNLLIAFTKLLAAAWTGSSAMMSEGIHSLVDTGNQGLLLYGMHRAAKPADEQHPLGYGRELYFWSFIVALLFFSLGAGASAYEGVIHIRDPERITDPMINYAVLGAAFIFEAISWTIAFREFNRKRGEMPIAEAVVRSRDPLSFIVLFEDSAALIGIVIAFAGTAAAVSLDLPVLDGVASIGIAVVLAVAAAILARETKGLLIGEPARERTRQSILTIARTLPGVSGAGRLITVHLSPDQIVAALDVDFAEDIPASEVECAAHLIERRVRDKHPDVIALFITPRCVDASQGT